MRLTLRGAWFTLTCLTVAACGGSQFTSGNDEASSGPAGSSASNNNSGKSAEADSSGAGVGRGGSAVGGGPGGPANGGGSLGGSTSTPEAGGSADGGSASTEVCVDRAVMFRMVPSVDLPHDYLCDASCGTGWLTLSDAQGAEAFSIFSACGTARCDTCEMLPCVAAACLPKPLTSEGNDLLWDGTYLAQDSCGKNLACQRDVCLPPGKYKAKACASLNGGSSDPSGACQPKDAMLCAEVEFTLPGSQLVELVLKKL